MARHKDELLWMDGKEGEKCMLHLGVCNLQERLPAGMWFKEAAEMSMLGKRQDSLWCTMSFVFTAIGTLSEMRFAGV